MFNIKNAKSKWKIHRNEKQQHRFWRNEDIRNPRCIITAWEFLFFQKQYVCTQSIVLLLSCYMESTL